MNSGRRQMLMMIRLRGRAAAVRALTEKNKYARATMDTKEIEKIK
jgi:hypothetical protein